jgi:hypothetical protein
MIGLLNIGLGTSWVICVVVVCATLLTMFLIARHS